jgi:hypothetical protein
MNRVAFHVLRLLWLKCVDRRNYRVATCRVLEVRHEILTVLTYFNLRHDS